MHIWKLLGSYEEAMGNINQCFNWIKGQGMTWVEKLIMISKEINARINVWWLSDVSFHELCRCVPCVIESEWFCV